MNHETTRRHTKRSTRNSTSPFRAVSCGFVDYSFPLSQSSQLRFRKSHSNIFARGLALSAVLLASALMCAAQSAPAVLKVEPPNWWAGHSLNPVRVLVRGKNLGGARVEAVGPGLQTGLTRVNAAGTYL